MFFKKRALSPETENSPAEPQKEDRALFTSAADSRPAPADADTRPIYIIGANALAVFLAARLQDSGRRVIMVSDPDTNTALSTNGVVIKEDYSLKKNRYRFNTSFWIKESPRLVIFTTSAPQLKSAATVVSPQKLGAAPILCFSLLKDNSWLRAIFGNNIINGYFEGWAVNGEQQVAVLGRAPSLTLSVGEYNSSGTAETIKELFDSASLNCRISEDAPAAFWNYFAVYAVGSLLSAAQNQNIFDILKNKAMRENARPLLEEVAALAAAEKAAADVDALLKKLYNIPNNYVFPLQDDFHKNRPGELAGLSDIITETARRGGCRIPGLSRLLKQLYHRSLDMIA